MQKKYPMFRNLIKNYGVSHIYYTYKILLLTPDASCDTCSLWSAMHSLFNIAQP